MYIAPSSGHISLNFNMPFKLILRRVEVVFWCLEWECCTFWKIDGTFIQIHQYYTMVLTRVFFPMVNSMVKLCLPEFQILPELFLRLKVLCDRPLDSSLQNVYNSKVFSWIALFQGSYYLSICPSTTLPSTSCSSFPRSSSCPWTCSRASRVSRHGALCLPLQFEEEEEK